MKDPFLTPAPYITLLGLFAFALFCLVMAFTTPKHGTTHLDCLGPKTYEAPQEGPKSARGAPIAAPEDNHAAR